MAIIRRDGFIWQFFARLLGLQGFEGGEIEISYGKSVVTIPTNAQPKQVWLTLEEPAHSMPVCCGDINMIGTQIIQNGFVLCADIKSDVVDILWWIEF